MGVLVVVVVVLGLGLAALFSTGGATGPSSTTATTSVFRSSETPPTVHAHGAGPVTITVPDVRGESKAEAVSELTSIGLDVQTSSACCGTRGYVASQAPGSGSKVEPRSVIELVVLNSST